MTRMSYEDGDGVVRHRLLKGQQSLPLDERDLIARLLAGMTPDEFARWMLDNHRYDINPETGTVTNCRTGKALKWIPGSDGYPYVDLAFSNRVQRPIRIHRFIAVKVWGVEACAGKHVAHLDRNRGHSWLSNLELMEVGDHNRFDGNHAHAKTSWPPCANCGDPDGKFSGRCKTPSRIDGTRLGISGQLCRRCYANLRKKSMRRGTWK